MLVEGGAILPTTTFRKTESDLGCDWPSLLSPPLRQPAQSALAWSNPLRLETRPEKLTGALGVYFLQLGIRSNGKLSQNWAKIGTFDNAARIAHRDAAEAGLGTPRSIHTGHLGHTQLLQRGARALKRHKRGAPPG